MVWCSNLVVAVTGEKICYDEIDRLVEGMCLGLLFIYFHNFSLEVLRKIAETLSEESVCDSKFKPGTSRIRKNANHSAATFLVQIG